MLIAEISCSGQLHNGEKLPTTEFYVNKNTKRGYRSKCKACFHLYDKNREANIKRKYLTEKTCSDCNETLLLKHFYRCNRLPTGYRPECKDCYSIRRGRQPTSAVKREPRTEEDVRLSRVLHKYNLTLEKYYEMLAEQEGRCAICKGDNGGKSLVVDHDHSCCPSRKSCGKCVRSLLCAYCNWGLGSFRDDIARLQAASQYLISHASRC